jgi:hypothetical protein
MQLFSHTVCPALVIRSLIVHACIAQNVSERIKTGNYVVEARQ